MMRLRDIDEQKERDLKSDLEFIGLLVDYVKRTPNKIWSKKQAEFINFNIKEANQNKDIYLKVKNIIKKS